MKDLIQSLSDLASTKKTKEKNNCDTGNMSLIKQLNESSASVKQYNRIAENYKKFKMRENMAMNQQNIASTDDIGMSDDGQVTPQQLQQMKAQQLKSLADQKKQVQDQIRQTEKLLVDLRKKLTDLNNPNNVSMMAEDQDDDQDDESNQENLDHREDFGEQSSDSKKVASSDKTSKNSNKK